MSHEHHHPRPTTAEARRAVRRIFIVTLVLNLVVAAGKGLYGYTSGSLALGSDAIHAVLDGSSNVLALLGLRWAARPADATHPYGRHKIEILASVGIGVLIVLALVELCEAAVRSLLNHRPPPSIGWAGFGVLGATMAINFVITRYEDRRGHELGSALLRADAQHTLSDLYASFAVMISFVGVRLGWKAADPIGAIAVILLVGRAAWVVFRDNVPALLDAAVLDPTRVAQLTSQDECVQHVTRVRSRGSRNAAQLELDVHVNPGMTIGEAHLLATRIEATLRHEFPELTDVGIHAIPRADNDGDNPDNRKPSNDSQSTDANAPNAPNALSDPHDL
ncbi:MAG TPA: cation diffusion facilitator family transporter [Polyangia bacterium]|nr:cation diffusion facilitator family transporter [Polyangia bacterium]